MSRDDVKCVRHDSVTPLFFEYLCVQYLVGAALKTV